MRCFLYGEEVDIQIINRMKHFLIIFLIMLLPLTVKGQQIEYRIPKQVEDALSKKLCTLSDTNQGTIYAHLSKKENGVFSIILCKNDVDGFINSIIQSTQRIIVINRIAIPLIFDYDMSFCEPDSLKDVGTFGNRDGRIMKRIIMYHGEAILFSKEGIIDESLF